MVDEISFKTLIGAKSLRIRFDKPDGFIRVYDWTRYLVLFGPEKYDVIYGKSGHTYVISHNYARIKIDSYDSLPLEKILALRNDAHSGSLW